jgi:hypothetical protein
MVDHIDIFRTDVHEGEFYPRFIYCAVGCPAFAVDLIILLPGEVGADKGLVALEHSGKGVVIPIVPELVPQILEELDGSDRMERGKRLIIKGAATQLDDEQNESEHNAGEQQLPGTG